VGLAQVVKLLLLALRPAPSRVMMMMMMMIGDDDDDDR
jgi:hypothetical protein